MSTLLLFGLLIWLFVEKNQTTRYYILHGFAFMKGVSLGPLLFTVIKMDAHELIWQAFLGTALIFGIFSLAALIAPRNSYLYLGAPLASALTILMYIGLLSLFFPGPFQFYLNLYLGLMVFVGYVLYDTQNMMAKASRGSTDYVTDALELFIDFVALFVRILIILSNNKGKKKNDK